MEENCLLLFSWPQTISMGLSSQWNLGRKRHLCPAFLITSWRSGFSSQKSFSTDSTHCMQQLDGRSRSSKSRSEMPWLVNPEIPDPLASFCFDFASLRVASHAELLFLQLPQIPTTLLLCFLSRTMRRPCSWRTCSIPLGFPEREFPSLSTPG